MKKIVFIALVLGLFSSPAFAVGETAAKCGTSGNGQRFSASVDESLVNGAESAEENNNGGSAAER